MLQTELEPRQGYLHAALSGELTLAGAKAAYTTILLGAARYGQPRILMDCTRLRGTWTPDERLAFGSFMAEEQARLGGQLKAPPQVAILAVAPLMDPGRFTQTVANNRGVRMRASDSLQELLSWLAV